MIAHRRVASLALALIAGLASSAQGQPHTEVFVGGGVASSSTGAAETTFVPVLENSAATGIAGSQRLALDPATAPALVLGVRRFFTPAWAIEVKVAYTRAAVGGENDPYRVRLTYTALLPPDFQPRPASYSADKSWPDTEGRLRRVLMSVNVVRRLSSGAVSFTGAAGVAWQRVNGRASALGYTAFLLGGRSVLFVSDYTLSAVLESTSRVGGDVAGEVSVALGPHVSLVTGYQAFFGPSLEPRVRLGDILESTPAPTATFDDIRASLTAGPARVPFTTGVLYFGVSVR